MRYLACSHVPTGEMEPSQPWLFSPEHDVPEHVRTDKKARQLWIQSPHTKWNYWTFHVGNNKAQRVSKSNPPNVTHGFAVDIDHADGFASAARFVESLPFEPVWIERSMGRKGCRLVFEFEEPINIGNFGLAENLNKIFAKKLEVDHLPGYDAKSTDPCMVWTNGAEWVKVEGGEPIPSSKTFAWLGEALTQWNTTGKMGVEVPLDVAYKLCKQKFGDRFTWPTESFELEQQGPTWYVEGSESEKSAVIKAHGIYSFSAHASDRPFRSWDDPTLLGNLVQEYHEVNIKEAVKDAYFDGKVYYHRNDITGHWVADLQQVFARKLKVDNQLSAQVTKGARFSEVEEALRHVEKNQRVEYGTALLCVRPGLTERDGKPVFNYANPVIVQPREKLVKEWGEGFPFMATFLDTVWDDPAGDEGVQRARFLLLAQRLYESFAEFKARRHPATFFVGPKSIGKTFITTGLLGTMLGGSNDPTSTLVEGNRFNADMLGTPIWSLDDPKGTSMNVDKFGEVLKRFIANPEMRSEQKFMQGGMGSFNGLVCVTMNDNASSLSFLPEVDRSNTDKWNFFKMKKSDVEFTDSEPENQAILLRELPAFVRWLVDWKPSAELLKRFPKSPRWGYDTYLHPRLLTASLDGSVKMLYKRMLLTAIRAKLEDLPEVKTFTVNTPELLRSMSTASHGTGQRFSAKNTDRYVSEFVEEGWPLEREHGEHGLSHWTGKADYFRTNEPAGK